MDKPSDYGSDIRGSNPLGGTDLHGEVAEWLKAAVSKTVIGATLSRVRISPSPQS